MPNYNKSTRDRVADLKLGLRVDRALATLPQTTTQSIFNVVGGRVQMTGILGTVTTLLGTPGNLSLEANPTVGTASVLCAVVASSTNEVGTLISITGLVGTAMLCDDAGGVAMQGNPIAVDVGVIDFRTSGSSTGAIQWSIWYIPLEDGAYVTAGA